MRMPNSGRRQRRYDHRLRNLVQRTGDVTIATDLGVPRSTARGWLGKGQTVVVRRAVSTDILQFLGPGGAPNDHLMSAANGTASGKLNRPSEQPMIVRMARRQQRYDHRLRDLVQR